MFEYFPENYPWSLATMWAINRGGAISEIDEACRPLKEISKKNDKAAQEAWYESWKKIAERVDSLGSDHERGGEGLSAGRKYLRASIYYFMGENDRQIPVVHAEKTFAAAVNSPQRKLKIFTLAEGGAEHCQVDNSTMAVDCIADWVARILGGDPQGSSPR